MSTCKECRKFFTNKGKCPKSKRLNMRACKAFAQGRPFAPKYLKKKLTEIKFDAKHNQAWSFWVNDTTVMVLVWEVDHNDYGHFRQFMIGLDDNGVVTKQFTARKTDPAFFGEIAVKGPGKNDVWASYGYEDADMVDSEGNIYNKPREIKIFPKRED